MVASEIPCLRARSVVFALTSGSRHTAIICSSVNLARFICPSFFRPDSNSIWRKYSVAGQLTLRSGFCDGCCERSNQNRCQKHAAQFRPKSYRRPQHNNAQGGLDEPTNVALNELSVAPQPKDNGH